MNVCVSVCSLYNSFSNKINSETFTKSKSKASSIRIEPAVASGHATTSLSFMQFSLLFFSLLNAHKHRFIQMSQEEKITFISQRIRLQYTFQLFLRSLKPKT